MPRHCASLIPAPAPVSTPPNRLLVSVAERKLRAAGPFFRSASSAMFEYGFPPPRIVHSAVGLKNQRERRMGLGAMLVQVTPFRMLDVRRRPPVVRRW